MGSDAAMRLSHFAQSADQETVEVTALLASLQQEVGIRGAAARELLAITFDPVAGNIEVVMRRRPLAEDYPNLGRHNG